MFITVRGSSMKRRLLHIKDVRANCFSASISDVRNPPSIHKPIHSLTFPHMATDVSKKLGINIFPYHVHFEATQTDRLGRKYELLKKGEFTYSWYLFNDKDQYNTI